MRRRNQALYDTDRDAWEHIERVITQLHDADVHESGFEERLKQEVRNVITGTQDSSRRIYLHDLIQRTVRATVRRKKRGEAHRLNRYLLKDHLRTLLADAAAHEAAQPIDTCAGARGELTPYHVT